MHLTKLVKKMARSYITSNQKIILFFVFFAMCHIEVKLKKIKKSKSFEFGLKYDGLFSLWIL